MSTRLTRVITAVILFVTTVMLSQSSVAQASVPAPFDTSFGSNGMAVHELPLQKSESFTSDIAQDASGNLFALFVANPGNITETFTIGKYSNDGSPVLSFGTNGRTAEIAIASTNFAVQPDGKILVAGYRFAQGSTKIIVYRFLSNGQIDTSFGNNGVFEQSNFPGKEIGSSQLFISINPDNGRIHLGFNVTNTNGDNLNFYFITLDSDGALDWGWGTSGAREVVPRAGSASAWSSLHAMKLLSDGSVLGIGSAMGSNGVRQIAIVKINQAGYLDSTFDGANNGNGVVLIQFGAETDAIMTAVHVLQNDDVVLAGFVGTYFYGPWYYGATRVLADGTVDTTFGVNGFRLSTVEGDFGTPPPKSLGVQSDGRYVFPINTGTTAGFMQIEANGAITSCAQCVWSGADDGALATSLVVQSDNKVVVAGMLRTEKNSVVRRFLSTGTSDGTFNNIGLQLNLERWTVYIDKSIPLPDGSIISTGTAEVGRGFGTISRGIIFKFTSSGEFDAQFGLGGYQFLAPPTDPDRLFVIDAIVQSDGKIVLLASGRDDNTNNEYISMWRINGNGSLDNTFGISGRTVTSESGVNLSPSALIATSDGKLIVALSRILNWTGVPWVYRYTSAGALDPSYTDGQNFAGGVRPVMGDGTGYVNAAILAQNDVVYIAGTIDVSSVGHSFIARLLPNGTLDSSFSGGYVSWPYQQTDSIDYIPQMLVDNQDRLVVLGVTESPTIRGMMIRLNADGTRDMTFNTTGSLIFAFRDPTQVDYNDVADFLPTNGGYTIVGGGDADPRQAQRVSFSAVVRTGASGGLDTQFGTNGIVLPLSTSESLFVDIAPLTADTHLITGFIYQDDRMKILLMKIGPTSAPTTSTTPPATTPVATVPPTTIPPSTTTTLPVATAVNASLDISIFVSQAALLKKTRLTVPRRAKVTMRVTTPQVCRVVKSKVRAISTGTCRVSLSVTTSKKKTTTRTTSFKIR